MGLGLGLELVLGSLHVGWHRCLVAPTWLNW